MALSLEAELCLCEIENAILIDPDDLSKKILKDTLFKNICHYLYHGNVK